MLRFSCYVYIHICIHETRQSIVKFVKSQSDLMLLNISTKYARMSFVCTVVTKMDLLQGDSILLNK